MKKFALVLILFSACSRDTVERASPPPSPVAPQAPLAHGPTLAFVDEGARDMSFAAYRDKLLAAVRARDAKGVVALADPKIRTSFGASGGAGSLEKMLARPGMFEQLEQILTLGGSFREGMFWAPYVYSTYPDSSDAFSTVAVIGEDVPLHAQPDASSKVLATLSRNIVDRPSAPGEGEAWQKVKTADGLTGYVESKFVRSPIDYRAGFLKSDGAWRMNALVAGD